MTKKQMTELFSVMLLAWPNAEMFKGGIQKLGPMVELWTSCLSDVDYYTGQRVTLQLCKEKKFPPTIAEFREMAGHLRALSDSERNRDFEKMKNGVFLHHNSVTEYYSSLRDGDPIKAVIDDMGGPQVLVIDLEDGQQMWNYYGFRDSYKKIARSQAALPVLPEKGCKT